MNEIRWAGLRKSGRAGTGYLISIMNWKTVFRQ